MNFSRRVRHVGWLIIISLGVAAFLIAQEEENGVPAADPCKPDTLQNYINLKDGCTVGPITFKFDNDYINMNGVDATKVNVEPVPSPPGLKYKFPTFNLPASEFATMTFTGGITSTAPISSGQIAAMLKDDAMLLTCGFTTPGGDGKTPNSSQISLNGRKYKLATGTYLAPVSKAKFKYALQILESSKDKAVPATDISGTFTPAQK